MRLSCASKAKAAAAGPRPKKPWQPLRALPAQPARRLRAQRCSSTPPKSDAAPLGDATSAAPAAKAGDDDEQGSPFVDALLRCAALGVGVGVLVEVGHVMLQCAALGPSMPDIITNTIVITELLSPLRVWDNLAAMTGTFVFYAVEVAAILAVMRQYPNDTQSANKAIQRKVTLPKRLMPLSVGNARRALYRLMLGRSLSAATAASSAAQKGPNGGGGISSTPSTQDSRGPAASDSVLASAVGTSVLERPPSAPPSGSETGSGPSSGFGPGTGAESGSAVGVGKGGSKGEGYNPVGPHAKSVEDAKAALERALAAPTPAPLPGPAAQVVTPPKPTPKTKGPSKGKPELGPSPKPILKKLPSLKKLEEAAAAAVAKAAAAPPAAGGARRAGAKPGAFQGTVPGVGSGSRAQLIRDRQAYLKNFWYVAALSSNLKAGRPLEVQILGRTVVLYRDAATGKPRCLDNVCPHRGAPLGKGWLKEVTSAPSPASASSPPTSYDPSSSSSSCSTPSTHAAAAAPAASGFDSSLAAGHGPAAAAASGRAATSKTCIVCPYHGWAFDGEGVLREVPSQEDQSTLPRRPLLDVYPVEEQGGFVWLFFGSSKLPAEERPPIPTCPELDNPGWTKVYDELIIEAPHWGVFDNQIDFTHVHYIHDDSFGNKSKPTIRDMEVSVGEFGITANFKIHNKPSNAMWEWTATESVPIEAAAFLPSSSLVKNYLGAGVQMVVFTNTVPIDGTRSIVRLCLARNFAGWDGLDKWARNAMLKILKEDKWVVELLRPEAGKREISLEADLPQVAFRRLRQQWISLGYGVEPAETQHHNGSLDM